MKRLRTRPAGRYATLGGVGVILLTGLAAALGMAANLRMEPIDWVLLALILLLTLGGVIGLARLIHRDPDAIGEARFDTSGEPTPPE